MGAFIQLADRRLLTLYGLNSLVIFFNQFRVLSSVREKSGWWRTYKYAGGSYPQWLNSRGKLAFANSLLNLLLFAAAAVFVVRFFCKRSKTKQLEERKWM